jgi:hypothetical protein
MNHLVAQLKRNTRTLVKIMSTQEEIFDQVDLSQAIPYSSSYKLEEDELFVLDDFSTLGFNNVLVGSPFNSTSYNQITTDRYKDIKYLCCKQNDLYYFQKMIPSFILSQKWFEISAAPSLCTNKPIIIISKYPDAIYDSVSNKLYFKEIPRIKTMFNNIESLFREATNEEVEEFLGQPIIELDNFNKDDVKTANRKRIASALEKLNSLTPTDRQIIFNYTIEYSPEVPVENGKFKINCEEHLKKVIYGIEERYYTTIYSREKRLANSVLQV